MKIIEKFAAGDYRKTGMCTMAFFGDSLTHGAFESDSEGLHSVFDYEAVYHNVLRQRMNRLYPAIPVSIINAGIGGEKASDALVRLERDVVMHRPNVTVVCFGLNDVGSGYDRYIQSLKTIFRALQAGGLECIFMSPNMFNTYIAEHTNRQLLDYAAVAAGYQNSGETDRYICGAMQAAADMGVPVADCYSRWKAAASAGIDTTAWLCNGINHPSREKHRLFADELLKTMQEK